MKKSIYLIVCLILFFIFHNKPLFAEESMLTLKQQLDRLQREVNDLSRSVFRDSNQSNANSKDNNDSQTEKFAAIDMRIYDLEKVIKKLTMNYTTPIDLEEDIRNLTMNLEEMVFKLDKINKRINKIEEDFDIKLQKIVVENSKENLNNISKKEDKEDIVVENSENTLGTLKYTSENNTNTSNEKDKVEKTNQNHVNADLKNLSPEDQFQMAFDQMSKKKYEQAKLSFQSFIDQNPENQTSGSAYYWLGKLYLSEKNYREAALIFAEGHEKYPNSIKAPNMLYEMAEALLEMDKNKEACVTLTTLSREFSSHKLKNKAEKKKLEISCDITSG